MLITTNAVVLKRQKLQDNDVLVTLFTDKAGKMKAIGKGAKSARSSMAAATQAFVFGEFVINTSGDWHQIRSIDILDAFPNLSGDLTAMTYASYLLELTNFLMEESVVHHRLFVTLVDALDLMSQPDAPLKTIRLAFEVKILDYCGYKMNLTKCISCSSENNDFKWFSIENGGIICDKCSPLVDQPWSSGKTVPKILDYMSRKDIRIVSKTLINEVYLSKIEALLKRYLKYHTGFSGSKSLELLESIQLL